MLDLKSGFIEHGRWLRAINEAFYAIGEFQLKELLFGVFFCHDLFNAHCSYALRAMHVRKQLMLQNKHLCASMSSQMKYYFAKMLSFFPLESLTAALIYLIVFS